MIAMCRQSMGTNHHYRYVSAEQIERSTEMANSSPATAAATANLDEPVPLLEILLLNLLDV